MKLSSKTKATLETILVIGLILIIPLFFAINSGANPPDTQAEISSIPPTVAVNAPEDSDAVKPQQPPACTFPLAETTMEESTPEEYTFSELEIVLSHPDNLYNIVEWLPDNQQVLMTQDLYDSSKSESDKFLRQSIELYNPQTGESKVYAIRHFIEEPPSWQPALNAVVYPAMNYLGIDKNTRRLNFIRQVRVSYGDPDNTQMLADDLPQFPLAIRPGGSEMVYLSDKELSKRNSSLQNIPSTPFDLTQWDYAKMRRNEFPVSYEMAWQPGTSLIFLHSNGGMQLGGGYTFILNADTGQVCELDLGGWAVKAHWSSDGRYLAIITAEISPAPVNLTNLAVLDVATGNLTTLVVIPQDKEGKHYVDDFAWAPDNRHLLAIGHVPQFQNTDQAGIAGLYLVDFMSGQSINLLSAHKFYGNMSQNNMAWSLDGSKLLIRCPTMEEDRVCFISVQRTEQ